MSRLDAEKVKNHFSIYTTEKTARSEYSLSPRSIEQQIAKNKIHPLPHSHKDYLQGQTTFTREEINAIYRPSQRTNKKQ